MKRLFELCHRYSFLIRKSHQTIVIRSDNIFTTIWQNNSDYHQNESSTNDTNTHDHEETKKFSDLSTNWWDINGPMRALHSMNKVRVPFIRDCLIYEGYGNGEIYTDKPLKGIDILDVGCGGGILTEPLARLGADVVGIDASEELIEIAKKHRLPELENLQYLNALVEDIALVGSLKFDAVVASEVIEHVSNPHSFIQTCSSVLKPKGSMVISTINKTLQSYLLAVNFAERVLQVVPRGAHDWNKFIAPEEVIEYLDHCDCSFRKIHGMLYNPFCDDWSFVSSTNMNYIIHAVKRQDIDNDQDNDID
ncbi:ubiquinone biosynthesis O-methyltransferase-like [Styela clava]